MHKRSFIMALAAGLVACSMSATGAIAGTVEVLKDAGTFSFTLTATSGTLNIQYSGVDLTSINGNTIPSVLSQLHGVGPEDVIVTSTMTSGAFTSYTLNDVSPGIKTFGISPGITSAASLEYQLFTGSASEPGLFQSQRYDLERGVASATSDAHIDCLRLFAHGRRIDGADI